MAHLSPRQHLIQRAASLFDVKAFPALSDYRIWDAVRLAFIENRGNGIGIYYCSIISKPIARKRLTTAVRREIQRRLQGDSTGV